MRALGPGRWGTRDDAPGLQGILWFADEARHGAVEDYVLAGVEDVSTDLLAVHFFVVYGRAALFVQVPVDRAEARLRLAQQVLATTVAAAADGLLPAGGPLVVVDTPFGLHHWEWAPEVDGGSNGLEGAAAWLADRTPPAPLPS